MKTCVRRGPITGRQRLRAEAGEGNETIEAMSEGNIFIREGGEPGKKMGDDEDADEVDVF